VSNEAELKAAILTGGHVTLTKNIALSSTITIDTPSVQPLQISGLPFGAAITLDCGHEQWFKITGTAIMSIEVAFNFLTIVNGAIA
jgi:hypothetical protein